MSNEKDLDWLARNVHKWQGAERCVSVCNGVIRWTVGSKPMDGLAWFTKHEWLARRAELQNKPSWETHEYKVIAQGRNGSWYGSNYSEEKFGHESSFCITGTGWNCICRGVDLGDWRDTLENRPEEFKLFTSIEDNQEQEMKQDNGWFERGELPPVGCECEILGAFGHYQEWFPCKIIAEHSGSVFAANERAWINVKHGERKFRPLRTERDELIEIISSSLLVTTEQVADAIIAAGFKLEAK